MLVIAGASKTGSGSRHVVIQQKHYAVLAIGALLAIPVVAIMGMSLTVFINPEVARGHANYVLNYRLLDGLKHAVFLLTVLAAMCLWFLTCYFLVKAKRRSIFWLSLAVLGPFGLIALVALRSEDQIARSFYHDLVGRLWIPVRVIYEVFLFFVVWTLAEYAIEIKRDLMILHQSIVRGVSIETIVDEQQASGGMWAFSEMNETIFLIVLFYVLWPTCFNLVARLIKTSGATPT
jgi:hypothetical protein